MSTQSVIHPVSQSKSAVASFPEPQTITQQELAIFLSLRGRLHQLQEQLEAAEQSLKDRLAAGASLESGDHLAETKENFRRNVAWREVCERLGERLFGNGKGQPYCEKVLHSTKPTRTVSLIVR